MSPSFHVGIKAEKALWIRKGEGLSGMVSNVDMPLSAASMASTITFSTRSAASALPQIFSPYAFHTKPNAAYGIPLSRFPAPPIW